MYLRLKNRRFHLANIQNFLNLSGCEVRQTDCPYFALLAGFFHQLVPGHIVTGRLVEQQKVNIIRTQTFQCLFYCVRLLIKRQPQLRLQENLLTVDTGFSDCAANCLFRGILSSVYVRFYEIASIFI